LLAGVGRRDIISFDDASRIELGSPHDFYKRQLVRSLVYGGMREKIVDP
jgi:hypothetical protein